MPIQPIKPLKTVTGQFTTIRLGFTPELPLAEVETIGSETYSTNLAYVHVYLDGEDAAELLPSAYILWVLDGLLYGLDGLLQGKEAIAKWFSDPWRFELHSIPEKNQVFITLQLPGKWIAMQDVCVPLDQFGHEVIRMAKQWQRYLKRHYADEIYDPGRKGQQHRLFLQHLANAERALQQYVDIL